MGNFFNVRSALVALISNIVIITIFTTFASSLPFEDNNNLNSLALHHHAPLKRLKRELTAELVPDTNSNKDASNNNNKNDQSPDGEDKEQDVAPLNEFKCDFGTSDLPDLCKIKIIDSTNPETQSLPGWSHGSGKLALYQGGPLLDASTDRNDSSGGYIFYETSNSFVNNETNNYHQNYHHQQSHFNQQLGANSPYAADSSSSVVRPTMMSYYKPAITSNHNPVVDNPYLEARHSQAAPMRHRPLAPNQHVQQQQSQSFQRLSSASLAIGGGGGAEPLGPAFTSPNLTAPGPPGMCLSFKYIIKGLSAEELKIQVKDQRTMHSRLIWASSESVSSNWTKGEVLYSVTANHSVIFSASSFSRLKDVQQRKFRGYIALDDILVAKHDPNTENACKGHCNFDGDLCGWTNAQDGEEDDFDWSFGRGSDNFFTGPSRDFISSTNNELTGSYLFTDSGYPRRPGDKSVLVSPTFQPTEVNDAMCMRIAVHMFGSGVGSLAIKIRYTDDVGPPSNTAAGGAPGAPGVGTSQPAAPTGNQAPAGAQGSTSSPASSSDGGGGGSERSEVGKNDLVVWEMSGDAGNSWHQAQTSISSSKSAFQVVVEGVIGENHLGNIAIDEISFSSGACPTSPPIASKNYGDCTFEQSMCHWRNPDAEIHLDDLDWIRSTDEQSIHGPNFDHTSRKRSGFYLKLENTFREPKSGTRAFLLSPIFQPKSNQTVQCISFYYYMFMRSVGPSGPNLGTIRVYLASNNELVPIWRLTNPISSPNWKHARATLSTAILDGQPVGPSKLFQIAFEGIWGDAPGGAIAIDDITVFDGACDILPSEARSVSGECTFDVDMCSWSNKTMDVMPNEASDASKSPFLQSVNLGGGAGAAAASAAAAAKAMMQNQKRTGWQLATVDSRPVNLQDHTYKAPVGYAYFDVLDGGSMPQLAPLQATEIQMPSGSEPIAKCLSFWFAAYGRSDANSFSVFMTQASVQPPDDANNGGSTTGGSSASGSVANVSPSNQAGGNQPAGGKPIPGSSALKDDSSEDSGAWRSIMGKQLWSLTLKNITETNRRRWQYAQTPIKADSSYIIRFLAASIDGGFALDDISFYDGNCETRPMMAKVVQGDDADQEPPSRIQTLPK